MASIAYQTITQSGEAVFLARAMLSIDVKDILPLELRNDTFKNNKEKAEYIVTLYPNPANNNVEIVNLDGSIIKTISVHDALGRTVYSSPASSDKLILNTHNFNNGLYHVKVVTLTGERTMTKISVIH